MTIETANRLYELRKNQGLSQEELAEKLGVSRQAVSKWERGEASPDTDNLIALAKIYGLSLDELIFGEKQENKQEAQSTEDKYDNYDDGVEISSGNIYVESDDGDKVKIDLNGIVVKSKNGDNVKIGLNGIRINSDDNDDDDNEIPHQSKTKFWLEVPYPIICAIAYLIFGCLDILGGWALSWIIFITIPIYYSLVEAIYNRRFSQFAYPVFTAFAYLLTGLYFGNWHPSWIIFITIPVYSCIADALDKIIKEKIQTKQ
jgi:transcriptional regulator with XRE-family HTH domain